MQMDLRESCKKKRSRTRSGPTAAHFGRLSIAKDRHPRMRRINGHTEMQSNRKCRVRKSVDFAKQVQHRNRKRVNREILRATRFPRLTEA